MTMKDSRYIMPAVLMIALAMAVCGGCGGSSGGGASAPPATAPACGNGTVETGEECDDGNKVTESCDYGVESCDVCGASCEYASGTVSVCGDGVTDTSNGEQCDDSNTTPGDGCSDSCMREMTAAAGGEHSCGLTAGGAVKCWGRNSSGGVGDGTTVERYTPVDAAGITSGARAVAAGGEHTCALSTAGAVKCWGGNSDGQLGDGTSTDRYNGVTPSGLGSGAVAVATGDSHTCALTESAGIKCWGDNSNGQLGDGAYVDRYTPVTGGGLTSGVAAIAAGGEHTCALNTAGAVKCWGDNSNGQLGDGTFVDRYTPVPAGGLTSGVAAIAAGGNHTCALTGAGAVKCWGDNSDGQLGDGTIVDRSTAVDTSGLASGVTAISAGEKHTCAITSAGAALCWGDNGDGRLGDGTNVDRYTPVSVSGITSGAVEISTGGSHTCAVLSSGSPWCWGDNAWGRLGDGTTVDRYTPVLVSGF